MLKTRNTFSIQHKTLNPHRVLYNTGSFGMECIPIIIHPWLPKFESHKQENNPCLHAKLYMGSFYYLSICFLKHNIWFFLQYSLSHLFEYFLGKRLLEPSSFPHVVQKITASTQFHDDYDMLFSLDGFIDLHNVIVP